MTRTNRHFDPQVRRMHGAPSRVRFSLMCHECGTDDFIEGPRVLPDDVVSKKFSQRGWVIGRNRSYDRCPLCVGVSQENKLATVFKVTKDKEPVPTPAEIAAQTSGEQRQAVQKTHAALDRLLCKNKKAAEKGCIGDRSQDPILAMMAHDLGEIRAILESCYAQNNVRDEQLKRQTAIFEAQMKGYERHMAMFEKLIAAQDRQTLLQEQLIRAIANIVPTLVRTSEGMTSGVTASVEKAMNTLAQIVAQEAMARKQAMEEVDREPALAAPEDTEDIVVLPAPAQTVEPVTSAETSVLTRRKASFSVTSYQDGKSPDKFLTMVSMDRATWEAAGFTPDDRYRVEHLKGRLVIARALAEKGVKAKKIGSKTVVLQTRNLGDLNYKRTYIQTGTGEILA
jgi:hypothetical protein